MDVEARRELTVLDAVSGTGLSFSFLIEAVGPSGHVVAIEHSPEMMALARIAVAGAKLTSWWLAPLNLWVLWRARRYLTTYDHLQIPWHFLAHGLPLAA